MPGRFLPPEPAETSAGNGRTTEHQSPALDTSGGRSLCSECSGDTPPEFVDLEGQDPISWHDFEMPDLSALN